MSTLVRCDGCGATIPHPGCLPPSWTCRWVQEDREKGRMEHDCPDCARLARTGLGDRDARTSRVRRSRTDAAASAVQEGLPGLGLGGGS